MHALSRFPGRWRLLLTLGVATLTAPASSVEPFAEAEVKAAFIYNFVHFVRWPDVARKPGDPFRFCVLDDTLAPLLSKAVQGENVDNHSLTVTRQIELRNLAECQILYVGDAKPHWFCDTVELFNVLLKPEQQRAVRIAYTQDMAQADWEIPRGHWFDVRQGFYVLGSKRQGSMGPTIASFAQEDAARRFATEHGGRVLRFAEIKPDMVDLSGGAQHDQHM